MLAVDPIHLKMQLLEQNTLPQLKIYLNVFLQIVKDNKYSKLIHYIKRHIHTITDKTLTNMSFLPGHAQWGIIQVNTMALAGIFP